MSPAAASTLLKFCNVLRLASFKYFILSCDTASSKTIFSKFLVLACVCFLGLWYWNLLNWNCGADATKLSNLMAIARWKGSWRSNSYSAAGVEWSYKASFSLTPINVQSLADILTWWPTSSGSCINITPPNSPTGLASKHTYSNEVFSNIPMQRVKLPEPWILLFARLRVIRVLLHNRADPKISAASFPSEV